MQTSRPQQKPLRILGLMTGSSADGLDTCLVEFSPNGMRPAFRVLRSQMIDYPSRFRQAFQHPLALSPSDIDVLDLELADWFAEQIQNIECDAVASHGQTIRHEPPHHSLQIGNAQRLANSLKIPVVSDFRNADIRAGGQGAPLIPIVDRLLLEHPAYSVVALNIGGIANFTIIPPGQSELAVLAWDTGPGNTLIDKAVRHYSGNSLNYDPAGYLAARGTINSSLLKTLLKHPFFKLPPPRSAGQEQFGEHAFNLILNHFKPDSNQDFKDLIATLTMLTAKTIAQSVAALPAQYSPREMHVSGGGLHNKTLMNFIKTELKTLGVKPFQQGELSADNKEAFGFAYLGYLRLLDLPGNLPSVTGARREVLCGTITRPD